MYKKQTGSDSSVLFTAFDGRPRPRFAVAPVSDALVLAMSWWMFWSLKIEIIVVNNSSNTFTMIQLQRKKTEQISHKKFRKRIAQLIFYNVVFQSAKNFSLKSNCLMNLKALELHLWKMAIFNKINFQEINNNLLLNRFQNFNFLHILLQNSNNH